MFVLGPLIRLPIDVREVDLDLGTRVGTKLLFVSPARLLLQITNSCSKSALVFPYRFSDNFVLAP